MIRAEILSLLLQAVLAASLVAACGKDSDIPVVKTQASKTAFLSVSDGPIYDFGGLQLGQSASKVFTVSNIGVLDASQMSGSFYLSAAFTFLGGAYPGTGGTCGVVLKVNEICTVAIGFSPTYTGSFQDSIQVSYFNGVAGVTTTAPIVKGAAYVP